jgi:hypothetical protein
MISTKFDTNRHKVSAVNNINVNVDRNSSVTTDVSSSTPKLTPVTADSISDGVSPYTHLHEVTPPSPPDLTVKYKDDINDRINTLERVNKALKLIITMMKENPIYLNSLILVDDIKLAELCRLLTNADEVVLDADDLGSGCFTRTYRKVNAIYIIKNGNTKNMKYDYPEVVKTLKEVGINTKYVW